MIDYAILTYFREENPVVITMYMYLTTSLWFCFDFRVPRQVSGYTKATFLNTSWYFRILCNTSKDFRILRNTLKYFRTLRNTLEYLHRFVLTSEKRHRYMLDQVVMKTNITRYLEHLMRLRTSLLSTIKNVGIWLLWVISVTVYVH